ncbi:MAG: hypothetical protein FWE42_06105 [Defluviitaleaceae bacterium]|nr:hypothetical protein [Defluviitaleaceae bacterium]
MLISIEISISNSRIYKLRNRRGRRPLRPGVDHIFMLRAGLLTNGVLWSGRQVAAPTKPRNPGLSGVGAATPKFAFVNCSRTPPPTSEP